MSSTMAARGYTYDAGKADAKREFGGNRVHPVEHMHLTGLVRILQMAIVEVLLEINDDLPIVLSVHHEDTCEAAVEGQRILTL